MTKCKCGSYAVNKDPERVKCDVCYAYQVGFAAGQVAEREACANMVGLHRVSISDLTGNGWDEWGYNIDIADAIRARGTQEEGE